MYMFTYLGVQLKNCSLDAYGVCYIEMGMYQMLVHVKDTKSVMIRTVDTDIVVLISRVYQTWSNSG